MGLRKIHDMKDGDIRGSLLPCSCCPCVNIGGHDPCLYSLSFHSSLPVSPLPHTHKEGVCADSVRRWPSSRHTNPPLLSQRGRSNKRLTNWKVTGAIERYTTQNFRKSIADTLCGRVLGSTWGTLGTVLSTEGGKPKKVITRKGEMEALPKNNDSSNIFIWLQ